MSEISGQAPTITTIDLAIRGEVKIMSSTVDQGTRTAALKRIEELKQQRHEMLRTKTYDKMLKSLK
jgi:hypothetical protein